MNLNVILISLCFIISCKNSAFQKVHIKGEYNQEIYSIDSDSLKQGSYIELTVDGTDTISIANYKNDRLEGNRKIFNKEGRLITLESYKDGIFHGEELTFHPNGKIFTKGNFVDGTLDSIFYVYYDTGELKERVTMVDNVENGGFEEYYKNGKIHWKGTFVDGPNEVGLLYEYDERGELVKKMDCGKYLGEYICQTIWKKGIGEVIAKLKYEE